MLNLELYIGKGGAGFSLHRDKDRKRFIIAQVNLWTHGKPRIIPSFYTSPFHSYRWLWFTVNFHMLESFWIKQDNQMAKYDLG